MTYSVYYHVAPFSFHPLKFSLSLHQIDSSFYLKESSSLSSKTLVPLTVSYLHWCPATSSTGTSSSAPSPLAIHRTLSLVSQSSYIFHLTNLTYSPTQISIDALYTPKFSSQLPTSQLCPYIPMSLHTSHVPNCTH